MACPGHRLQCKLTEVYKPLISSMFCAYMEGLKIACILVRTDGAHLS